MKKILYCGFFTLIFAVAFSFSSSVEALERTTDIWGLPINVTEEGVYIDDLFYLTLQLTVFVFIATHIFLIYCLFKYRSKRNVAAIYTHGNNRLELVWTAIPAIIFIVLYFLAYDVWWNKIYKQPEGSKTLDIEIVAEQFGWNFRYPGKDGKLGKGSDALYSLKNKTGKDLNDPNGKDDFTTYNDMVIPAGRTIQLYIRSRDVIHSFYVPEFRMYQDTVPGRTISWVHFTTLQPGNFALVCNQLCGSGHYNMQAKLRVLPPNEYDAWEKSKMK